MTTQSPTIANTTTPTPAITAATTSATAATTPPPTISTTTKNATAENAQNTSETSATTLGISTNNPGNSSDPESTTQPPTTTTTSTNLIVRRLCRIKRRLALISVQTCDLTIIRFGWPIHSPSHCWFFPRAHTNLTNRTPSSLSEHTCEIKPAVVSDSSDRRKRLLSRP